MPSRRAASLTVLALSVLLGGWLLQRRADAQVGTGGGAALFQDVLSYVEAHFVDSLPEEEIFRRATDGLLDRLNDPYTELLTGETLRQVTEQTSGNYAGLGIQIDVRDGWITIVAPLPETPAERAGIQTGDQIIEVDGVSTQGWNSDRAVATLRGAPGAPVKILVRRPGVPDPLPFELTREEIHVRSVQLGSLFPGGVGYVSLTTVSESSAEELRAEIERLLGEGATSLVLDLRGNPGGLLEQGVQVTDLFLDPGQEIVSTRGRTEGASRQFADRVAQPWPELPLVVLVDEGSASASEIIAGALQDHDRAVVVGTPTFGKGSVQTLYQLRRDAVLKITTAHWYTPSGRSIQRDAETAEDQIRQVIADATGRPDSAVGDPVERPIFRTDAGRAVRGGGGIVPDLVVRRDTITAEERAFTTALGGGFPVYRDVLTSYALGLREAGTIRDEAFTVTPAMRAEVFRRLSERGVGVDAATFAAAGRYVDEQVAYEIARYVFGRAAEFRRRVGDDRQVSTAIDLLRQAGTPARLMELTMTRAGADPEAR